MVYSICTSQALKDDPRGGIYSFLDGSNIPSGGPEPIVTRGEWKNRIDAEGVDVCDKNPNDPG